MSIAKDILLYRKKVRDFPKASYRWLSTKLQNRDKKFTRVFDKQYFRQGKFYFIKYDLKSINKTQKLEQYSPMLLVDERVYQGKKYYYGFNFNFLPLNIKIAFFSDLIDNQYLSLIEENKEKNSVIDEKPLPVDYEKMNFELLKYGYDYAIREYRDELVNEIYMVSTDELYKFITIHTQSLTGVDDDKLNQVWMAKLKTETIDVRMDEMFRIKSNYENIIEELKEKFKNLEREIKDL